MRTYQLRRYAIQPGRMSDFTSWMDEKLIPARQAHGYRVEFKLVDNENSQYVWCVSLPTDQAGFLEIQKTYSESQERTKAFDSSPNCFEPISISFVEALDLPK